LLKDIFSLEIADKKSGDFESPLFVFSIVAIWKLLIK